MSIKEQIHDLSDEMITNIGRLVAIDSQLGMPGEGKPFGEGPAEALKEGLKIAEELGFKTVNLDNYCGYAEMGEGEEIVGIAGHLDIVPVGGDWTYDPFKLTREGDYIYGRGTTDDKGPVIEALYAMKLLRDSGVKLNKRVRLIMGCNEETGSKCMEHYNEVEEELSCGFTPDANFPCIHGEKGHMSMVAYSKNTKIISMNGGFVSNAVCDACTTVIPAEAGLKEKLEEIIKKSEDSKVIKEGIRVGIIGRPNVGKSSLLNSLLEEEKAIVTDVPGTTRDIVEGSLIVSGIPLNIIDTAGIRKTEDTVEKIGVEKSLKIIDTSDLLIYILNNNEEITEEEKEILEKTKNKKRIIVVNKIDLKTKLNKKLLDSYIEISVKENIGIDKIKDEIKRLFNIGEISTNDMTYLSNARSIALLKKSLNNINDAINEINNNNPIDIVELSLKESWNNLGEVIGETYTDELLDELFSRFCLGK